MTDWNELSPLEEDNNRLRSELAGEKKRAWALRYEVIQLEMDNAKLREALEECRQFLKDINGVDGADVILVSVESVLKETEEW